MQRWEGIWVEGWFKKRQTFPQETTACVPCKTRSQRFICCATSILSYATQPPQLKPDQVGYVLLDICKKKTQKIRNNSYEIIQTTVWGYAEVQHHSWGHFSRNKKKKIHCGLMILNWINLGFGLLDGQIKTFEDITVGSGINGDKIIETPISVSVFYYFIDKTTN